MVKFVINANQPMKTGLYLLLASLLVFLVYAYMGIFEIKVAAIAVAILGAIFYAIGRTKQIWEKRY